MSEIVREALQGTTGIVIQDQLQSLIEALKEATLHDVRSGGEDGKEARYQLGRADGVQLALNTIMELGRKK